MRIPVVITSINKITEAVKYFDAHADCDLFFVGDKKTPRDISLSGRHLDVEVQQNLPFRLSRLLPFNHYCRKNLGYLCAIAEGNKILYETDDDNIPYESWGETVKSLINAPPEFSIDVDDDLFVNPYSVFSKEFVWPRGFPLQYISKKSSAIRRFEEREIGVWQGLADSDPDVDAIYRLLFNDPVTFEKGRISICQGIYAPFNSQNTLWMADAFFALYLPHTVSFRFTDILRSYVAKRLLDHERLALGFHEATVVQNRNVHDLMSDFRDEVPMYQQCVEICVGLSKLDLVGLDRYDALLSCYQWLEKEGYVGLGDVDGVTAWITDLKSILNE